MSPEQPIYRRLRVFAIDPGLAMNMGKALFNEFVLQIPWEPLTRGPVGEYVAVVDQDDSGRQLFPPVDLDDPSLLAQDGLTPSDGNPKFHQQMVYAVAMRTIGTFEKALGRRVQWAQTGGKYTRRIELRPHYMNVANAFFEPRQSAINFGYIEADPQSLSPGMIVFTCLSQDVVAHLVSHAFLFAMPFAVQFGGKAVEENPDAIAFQEGFCDLVSLLQRFQELDLLRHELAWTGGDLAGRSYLGILAPQFGEAIGSRSGIRSAYGIFDEDGNWRPKKPDPKDYQSVKEPHMRGELLLGAVFDALNRIYISRTADLFRIQMEGSGILLPEGKLYPDLVNRLALEAAKSAKHVLNMCIRALDYCPSVDITFGDYLRAIITSDYDAIPVDQYNYRVAFVEAFRRYGIFPANIGTLSTETLLWPKPDPRSPKAKLVQDFIRQLTSEYSAWNLPDDREHLFKAMQGKAQQLKEYLSAHKGPMKTLTGIDPKKPFTVHSIWPRICVSPSGDPLSHWVIRIIQGKRLSSGYRWAGCTLVVDADTGLISYAIRNATGGTRRERKPKPLLARFGTVTVPPPVERRLRVFAFDPSSATQMETVRINQLTLHVPWEPLTQGPVGKYLEVVDIDPATGCFYNPVDLNDKHLIAEDGHPPSQGNPQFHQQMVYAVAMRTIRNFEHALGRLALWSPHNIEELEKLEKERKANKITWDDYKKKKAELEKYEFVERLRIYPHALREANAFYTPVKKALLFGYFQSAIDPNAAPVTIFTCLSHDIIVHELTHALLDGMHRRFAESSNPDVLAFHEAFADLVALFQHFSMPEVLENQIAATRGDLASQNRLGELAQEFGTAIGNRGALRSAIGEYDQATGQWRPRPPDPEAYLREMEPHARGSLLVAAVFDAFLTLYRSRITDLFRIATKGTGVLPAGQLHPDLVRRLATEAADSAQDVLEMCIRALDYCPTVDMTFGDYLRAIITADYEFDPVDEQNRRIAFIEAFRRHGILPEGVRAFSLEALLWKQTKAVPDEDEGVVLDFIPNWTKEIKSWNLSRDRRVLYDMVSSKQRKLHDALANPSIRKKLSFLDPDLAFEVHALRPSARVDLKGKSHLQWIIEITQSIPDFYDADKARELDDQMAQASVGEKEKLRNVESDYRFRGGATLLVDAETGRVRYSIPKLLWDQSRRERQRRFMSEIANRSLYATYFRGVHEQEPFAALHRFLYSGGMAP